VAELSLRFDELVMPDGEAYDLSASLAELDEERKEEVTEEGQVKGETSKKRDAITIGAGAGIGAAIGAIAGGGKGAGTGAAIGRGAPDPGQRRRTAARDRISSSTRPPHLSGHRALAQPKRRHQPLCNQSIHTGKEDSCIGFWVSPLGSWPWWDWPGSVG
jgi:hypothetical protein